VPIGRISNRQRDADGTDFTNKNKGINKSAKKWRGPKMNKAFVSPEQKKRRMLIASAFLTASENVSWLF
jgi:hypothetical protein